MQESSVELQMRGISERCSNKTKKQRRTGSKEKWDAVETYIPPHVRGTLGRRILATAQKSFQYRKICVSPHLRAHVEFLTLLTYEGVIRYIFDSRHELYFKISCLFKRMVQQRTPASVMHKLVNNHVQLNIHDYSGKMMISANNFIVIPIPDTCKEINSDSRPNSKA
jgi:hypothetical protein